MTDSYEDIINLSRPVSKKHPPMPQEDRAAQFAPFAALTGHGAAIRESARLTQDRQEIAADLLEELDEKLAFLRSLPQGERASVTVNWFEPDGRKSGGAWRTGEGRILRIDPVRRIMILECDGDPIEIRLDDIMDLEIASGQGDWE